MEAILPLENAREESARHNRYLLTAEDYMKAEQQAAITAPTGGATVDAESRTAINAIISALEAHGLVADN